MSLLFGVNLALSQTPAGQALRFDGTDDLVIFGRVAPLGTHTIEAWIKPQRESTGAGSIVAGHVAGPSQSCSLGMDIRMRGRDVCYSVDISGCGSSATLCQPVNINQWTHVAGTYEGNTMRLFVDGTLMASRDGVPFNASNFMSAGAVLFFNGPQAYYPGELDELRIWNVARTPEEITEAMNRPLTGREPGLVGYWKFDEGSGQQVSDSSSSAVTGLLGISNAIESSDPSWVQSSAPIGPYLASAINGASFQGLSIAPGQIVSLFGVGLTGKTAWATTLPLPTTLVGTDVTVIDSLGNEYPAPLFYVSPSQINLLVPPETAKGDARISARRAGSPPANLTTRVSTVAPGLFAANANGQGVASAYALLISRDGSRSMTPVFMLDSPSGKLVPAPINLGSESDQVFLLLFGTGVRGGSSLPTVVVGGELANVLSAGPQGEYVGLDQINVGPLSRRLVGRGEAELLMFVDGIQANTVLVNIR